jgi:thiamine-monophosphate kinase
VTIGELGGEFALIERLASRFGPPAGGLVVGVGDDAALIGPSGSAQQTVVTTDLLLEDVHFRRRWCDAYSLGVKSAAVNLSDIAAMGGTPTFAFISLAVPPKTEVDWVDDLYRGMGDTFGYQGVHIAGGDTNVSPDRVVISVTLMGKVWTGKAALRRGAKPGDAILVTGPLGDAAAGLALLEEKGRDEAERLVPAAVQAQLRPVPRLAEGRWLADIVTAMMDLSDGLLADTAKLCRASGVRANILKERVPIGAGAKAAAPLLEKGNAETWALQGGEDYQLLCTTPRYGAAKVIESLYKDTGTLAYMIGEIVAGSGVWINDSEGQRLYEPQVQSGWDHFRGE